MLLLVVTAGCGTTQTYHNITSGQRNDAWLQVPINRIAVVAVMDDRGGRVGSETVFGDELKQMGIDAIVTYDFAPNLESIDTTAEVVSMLAERNIDAALTIAVAQAAAGYDGGDYWEARGCAYLLGSDNTRAWGDLADAASYYNQRQHALDIGLWDGKSMDAFWHAQTDSDEFDEGSAGVTLPGGLHGFDIDRTWIGQSIAT
jgi:hypothetical protein